MAKIFRPVCRRNLIPLSLKIGAIIIIIIVLWLRMKLIVMHSARCFSLVLKASSFSSSSFVRHRGNVVELALLRASIYSVITDHFSVRLVHLILAVIFIEHSFKSTLDCRTRKSVRGFFGVPFHFIPDQTRVLRDWRSKWCKKRQLSISFMSIALRPLPNTSSLIDLSLSLFRCFLFCFYLFGCCFSHSLMCHLYV